MKNLPWLMLFLLLMHGSAAAQDVSGWRPENRTGVSAETGLLKSWPDGGPALLWSFEKLPEGHSSPAFGQNRIFITGQEDSEDMLFALDRKGKLRWKKAMGRAWNGSYPASRATPIVEGDRVYTCSGFGDLACFQAKNGKKIWSYKASEKHKGTYGKWGIAESLLVDGDKLYFTPGGPETMMIALDKKQGKLIWKSSSLDDNPSYVSPILIDYAGKKTIINTSPKYVFAIDAASGDILWKVDQILPENFKPGREVIKCVTPLYHEGRVYVTSGYNNGAMMIEITADGKSAQVVWTDDVLDVHHGGVVLVDGYIYGANWLHNRDGNWCCVEWETGKTKWEEHWHNKGSIISAEGMLYIYDEKDGNVGLLKATPEKFDLVSSFQVTLGDSGPFWAHPVIHEGILYLRHNNALVAYDIRKK